MPIDDWVADMAANGRARRLGRHAAHVIFHQLSAMNSRSSAPTVSHTCIILSPYIWVDNFAYVVIWLRGLAYGLPIDTSRCLCRLRGCDGWGAWPMNHTATVVLSTAGFSYCPCFSLFSLGTLAIKPLIVHICKFKNSSLLSRLQMYFNDITQYKNMRRSKWLSIKLRRAW